MSAIPLHRLGRPVQSFLWALGQVRETRLTAALGFLTARFPDEFLPLLWGKGYADISVSVEETSEGDRYDVLLKGGQFPVVLEGKRGFRQSPEQLLRYVRNVREVYGCRPGLAIVDVGSGRSQGLSEESAAIRRQVKWIRRTTWTDVAKTCRRIVRRKTFFREDRIAAAIAEDLLAHLEENQMITDERPEVYLRDLSTRDSVELYFRHNIYKCQSKFFHSAQNNLYFAPYIAKPAAKLLSASSLAPVVEGISYVSRIKEVQVVPTKQLRDYLKAKKVQSIPRILELIGRRHEGGKVLMVMLGKPYRLFLTPVTKAKLGRVKTHKKFTPGAMGSRSCSLEELLSAAGA